MTNLNALLDDVQVDAPGLWRNDDGPSGWWAVSTDDDGIIAYFHKEEDACRFRLNYINTLLNPVSPEEA